MTVLRDRMIGDMKLAGLSARTQQAYVQAVKRLAVYYGRRPDRLTEEEVRVKRASRPGGTVTRKVEMSDLARTPGGHAGRQQRRREACAHDLEDEGEALTYPESEQ